MTLHSTCETSLRAAGKSVMLTSAFPTWCFLASGPEVGGDELSLGLESFCVEQLFIFNLQEGRRPPSLLSNVHLLPFPSTTNSFFPSSLFYPPSLPYEPPLSPLSICPLSPQYPPPAPSRKTRMDFSWRVAVFMSSSLFLNSYLSSPPWSLLFLLLNVL